ncbi:hypothetical protein ACN38_g3376 [Penicillium nordicum]|uniref:Uncharacterized protein n=1 Tax=Penicillium nordicum TaxID=229535 RepID=A0A0M8P5Q1_9EURO|nr:hypothetical protein ACN38_g3376 [Penicillium nordicum]
MNEEWLEGRAFILFMHLLLFQILLSVLFIDSPVDLQKNNNEAKMNSRMSHEHCPNLVDCCRVMRTW